MALEGRLSFMNQQRVFSKFMSVTRSVTYQRCLSLQVLDVGNQCWRPCRAMATAAWATVGLTCRFNSPTTPTRVHVSVYIYIYVYIHTYYIISLIDLPVRQVGVPDSHRGDHPLATPQATRNAPTSVRPRCGTVSMSSGDKTWTTRHAMARGRPLDIQSRTG